MPDAEIRERLARLESDMAHLTEDLRSAVLKVTEMHELMLRSRGAWWVIVAAGGVGGFLLSLGVKALPFLGGMPK